jgi:hypothetical protein
MGQGFSLTTLSAGSANIDVPELADLQYEKSLGAARFMKAVRARHKDGLVVARVVMKPYAQFNFHVYVQRLLRMQIQGPQSFEAANALQMNASCLRKFRMLLHIIA